MLDADVEVDRREFTVRAALQVASGERLALFGPSGAGKTTLLEVIAGLVQPRRARIELGGRVLTSTAPPVSAVPPWQRGVGLLRQDPGLFPHLSVRDNLGYACSASRSEAELPSLAAALGIAGLLSAMPARLSGGQAHRVALGRLLLARCDTLLLDEPFTGLDASLRRSLTNLVSSLVAEQSVPSILVTHELADAQAYADRLAVLDRGEILQVGPPDEVVLRPASRRVAELIGYLGFVPSGNAVAGVHPERVVAGAFADRGLVLTGAVVAFRPAGAGWEADLRVGEEMITFRLLDRPPSPEEQLVVTALSPPYFGAEGDAISPARATSGHTRPLAAYQRLVRTARGEPSGGLRLIFRRYVFEEAQGCRGRGAAPGQQDLVEAIRLSLRDLHRSRDRIEGGSLPLDQVGRVAPGPVQQGKLDQQVRPHVPDVLDRRVQPVLALLATARGDGIDRALRAKARLDRGGRDETGVEEPADRPVDHGPGDAPDPAELAIGRGEQRHGEAVRGTLTEQDENRPLGQRHRHFHVTEGSGSASRRRPVTSTVPDPTVL